MIHQGCASSNPTKEISLCRITQNGKAEEKDTVIRESPLTIYLNDEKELVTLLCIPGNPEYLAVGFLVSEGLVKNPEEIVSVESRGEEIISVELKDKTAIDAIMQKKHAITSGCGRAGVFYEASRALASQKIKGNLKITSQKIFSLVRQVEERSKLFKTTGGVHCAGLSDGEAILMFYEDIGRHNAVDKVLGESFLKRIPLEDKLIITSGRVSSEIIVKATRMRLSMVVSRSAPTDLAVDLANEFGITLVGFVRGLRMNVYAHPQRLTG